MKFKIELAASEVRSFSIGYRLQVLGIIKEFIRRSSEIYYTQLFDKAKRNIKPYCFATYFDDFEITNNQILTKKMIITIKSPDYEFIMHLMNGTTIEKTVNFFGQTWEIRQKTLDTDKPMKSTSVIVRTQSPILIENSSQQPIIFSDADFTQELNYYANLNIASFAKRQLIQPILLNAIKAKHQVAKENLHQTLANQKFIYLTGSSGLFSLSGHPEDLHLLTSLGLGKRTGIGFGMIDVVKEGS